MRLWSYSSTEMASVYSPVFKSTTRVTTRSLNTSSTLRVGSSSPTVERMLRLKSSSWLAICAGRKSTAAPDTSTEQTKHNNKVTVMVFLTVSLLATCQPPLNIRLDHPVVNQRCKQVGKQNRQHHPLRERRIYHSNDDHHKSYQDAKPPFACIGHGGGDRIGRHKNHAERKTTHNHMPIPRHGI